MTQADKHRLLLDNLESRCLPPNKPLPLQGDKGSHIGQASPLLQDVFVNGSGLGLRTWHTWRALSDDEWLTAADIMACRRPVTTRSALLAQLAKLTDSGLATRQGRRWLAILPSIDELADLAKRRGVSGRVGRRVERMEAESHQFDAFHNPGQQDPIPAEWGLHEGKKTSRGHTCRFRSRFWAGEGHPAMSPGASRAAPRPKGALASTVRERGRMSAAATTQPRPSGRASEHKPETIHQARDWDRYKNTYLAGGLCHRCSAQAAWGHQCGFTLIRPPCEECVLLVAALPERAAGAVWRRHGSGRPIPADPG